MLKAATAEPKGKAQVDEWASDTQWSSGKSEYPVAQRLATPQPRDSQS